MAGVIAGSSPAAAEGDVHAVSLDIGPGILGTIRVLSTNGETYSIFANNDITLGYDLLVDMQWGEIKGWGIYWGECDGDACFNEAGTPLLDSKSESEDTFTVNASRVMQIPAAVLGITSGVDVAGTDDFSQIVDLCNDWLAGGGDITAGTGLIYNAKATVGIDVAVDISIPHEPEASAGAPYSYPPAYVLSDVDHSPTFEFPMTVMCAAYEEPQSAGAPTGVQTELPEADLQSVQLALDFSQPSGGGAPHEYAGRCPVNVNLSILVGTNIATPIWVWIKHTDDKGNNWTSAPAEFQTDQVTNAGTWTWERSEPLLIPVNAAAPPPPPAIPIVMGGSLSVVNPATNSGGGQIDGADPTAVATGFEGDPDRHVGQVQLFAGIGRNVVPLLDTDGGITNVVTYEKILSTDLKTYDVTCEPEVNPAVGQLPGDVQTAAFIEDAFLAAVPQATADGSSCGVWANGWVRSNVGNIPVTLRLRNQAGDLSGSQTVWTNPETKTAYLLEFFDFSGSGEGVWVQPGGGWSMPDASNVGDQEGVHEGSYQIVVESPAGYESNVATYDFSCQAVGGLDPEIASPTPQPPGREPSLPQPSGELTGDPAVQPSLDVPPIISLVLDDASVDPQHGYVNVPLGQDGFWTDGYSATVTWRVLVGAVINPALAGVGTQWTSISANVGPWGGGSSTALTPQLLSLSDPPTHEVLQADYVNQFMSSGDNTPQDICNTRRQELLDQGQSLAGVLGNHHIIDITNDELPRAQINAALAYEESQDPYSESAVAVLPLRIRCLGNPAIAEQFLPSGDAPGGVATPENFALISAGLSIAFGDQPPAEPATYEGTCSTNGTVGINIAANLSGTAQYQVLHLSEANVLTASALVATPVNQFNNGGYWEFTASFDAVSFPIDDQVLPGFSTEPGGFVTGNFSVPAAGDLIGNNANDPNVHTGFFRVMASPLGVPQPTADSLWKKYRITCQEVEGGIGDVAAGAGGSPPPRLDMTKSGPPECRAGANCPLNVRLRNPDQRPYPGPLSLRIASSLAGTRLTSSNWQCAQLNEEISCQARPDGLAPGGLSDLQFVVRIPVNATPGSQFRSCALAAPPRPEVDPIRFAQFMLTRLGFEPGGIDGRDGPNTREAVRAFQRVNNLQATGVVDETLVLTLLQAGGPFAEQGTEPACATVAIARAPDPAPPPPPATQPPPPPVISTPAPPPQQPPPLLPFPAKPRAQPQVVVTCTSGRVQGLQCICPPRWTRQTVTIAPTARIYNCVPPR